MKIIAIIKRAFTVRLLLGLLIGGILGFAWYYFVGCTSSGCSITSDPYRMTGFGMLFGALLLSK
jgi:hypothetical protein